MTGTAVQDLVTPPAANDLLSAWEVGLPCSIPQRAVVLLGAVLPERALGDLLSMSLGERDEHLLEAHRVLFGPRLTCVVTCPSCSADLELDVAVDDLLESGDDGAGEVDVEVDGWAVQGRLLSVQDVLDAAGRDAESARTLLLERSIVSTTGPGDALPREVEDAFLADLARRNPTGALDIEQTCPECRHVWRTAFDAVSYLWAEIDGWAQRVLHEVHGLATAYGWAESDILALSPVRRSVYLEMAGHA